MVAGDAVFSGTHVFLFSTKTLEERQAWLKALDEFEALKPAVVVPGHSQNNRQLDPSSIQFTRRYMQTFEKQLAVAKNGDDLIARMKKLYPKLGLLLCLEFSAKGLKDGWQWDGDWHPKK